MFCESDFCTTWKVAFEVMKVEKQNMLSKDEILLRYEIEIWLDCNLIGHKLLALDTILTDSKQFSLEAALCAAY